MRHVCPKCGHAFLTTYHAMRYMHLWKCPKCKAHAPPEERFMKGVREVRGSYGKAAARASNRAEEKKP